MYYAAIALLYLIAFAFGSVIGSFLNVVVYRLPLGISVVGGRSFCNHCHRTLRFYEMVPVFSWLALKGRCRTCGEKIPGRYTVVELLSGLMAMLCCVVFGFSLYGVVCFLVGAVLLTLSLIDIDTMAIPDRFHICLLVLVVFSFFLNGEITLASRLIGFFALSVPMLVLNFFIADAFGGGDIKLLACCGLLLGWQNLLVGGFIGLLLGGAYGVALLIKSRENRKKHFPFGPFLAFGIFVALLWGESIIGWYVKCFWNF